MLKLNKRVYTAFLLSKVLLTYNSTGKSSELEKCELLALSIQGNFSVTEKSTFQNKYRKCKRLSYHFAQSHLSAAIRHLFVFYDNRHDLRFVRTEFDHCVSDAFHRVLFTLCPLDKYDKVASVLLHYVIFKLTRCNA